MKRRLTVVGARGFTGGTVAALAAAHGWEVAGCSHDAVPDEPLGVVAYCSGVPWDAQRDPLAAYRLHAAALLRLVAERSWERIVYVSSTRVYDRAAGTSETDETPVLSEEIGDTYALSKLAGEAIVLAASRENRVVRCSNVYGESLRSGLFLSDILRQLATTGRIVLRTSLDSSKDYVSVHDVASRLLAIASGSRYRLYNVAAGRRTTHRAILDAIAREVPVEVAIPDDAPTVVVPEIDVRRLQSEFPFEPRDVVSDLPALVRAFCAALR